MVVTWVPQATGDSIIYLNMRNNDPTNNIFPAYVSLSLSLSFFNFKIIKKFFPFTLLHFLFWETQ